MTKIKNLLVLMLVLALGVVSACKDEAAGETEQQKNTRMLSKTWSITNVDVTGSDAYDYVSGTSTITFTQEGTYTVTNPQGREDNLPEIREPYGTFPTSGTWEFASTTNFNTINLTAGTATITLTNVSIGENALGFDYLGAIGKAENEVSVSVDAVPAE